MSDVHHCVGRQRIKRSYICLFINSGYFYNASFKSTTTQQRSRHSTVPEFQAEEPQATASEVLPQDPYVAARAIFKPAALRMKLVETTNEPRCPTMFMFTNS